MVNSASFQPSAAAGLRWCLFDFGRADAEVTQAKGGNAQASTEYRHSMLRVIEDVENSTYRRRPRPTNRMTAEFYADLLWLHIGCVATSGTLFAVRGLATCLGARWTMVPGLRYWSYVLDTLLLCAGLSLAIASHQYPFVAPWLTAKVLLLPLYVVLGSYALKRARTPQIRATCYITALAVFVLIISVARTRNAAGLLAVLFS